MHLKPITKILLFLTLITLAVLLNAGIINAQGGGTPSSTPPPPAIPETFSINKYLKLEGQAEFSQNGVNSLGMYILKLINFLAMVIGSFSFLAIVVGGFMMISSGGEEAQVTRGKDIVKFAIIGLIVVLIAFFLVSFVQSIFYEYNAENTK